MLSKGAFEHKRILSTVLYKKIPYRASSSNFPIFTTIAVPLITYLYVNIVWRAI